MRDVRPLKQGPQYRQQVQVDPTQSGHRLRIGILYDEHMINLFLRFAEIKE